MFCQILRVFLQFYATANHSAEFGGTVYVARHKLPDCWLNTQIGVLVVYALMLSFDCKRLGDVRKKNESKLLYGAITIDSLSRRSADSFLDLSMSAAQKKVQEVDLGPSFNDL